MVEKIRIILKNNCFLYNIYYVVLSTLLKIVGIFIKTDEKIILINSFGGKKYDDSPKSIYEYMVSSNNYKNFKIYWALDDINIEIPGPAKKIKNNTVQYFIIALKAKYWISNSSIERGLKFKKKNTIYINTWHGSTLKKMGVDTKESNFRFNFSKYDYMFAQSKYDIDIFSHAFEIPRNVFVLKGLPRNDELYIVSKDEIRKIKEKLDLPLDKKIILYAPTFRDYDKDQNGIVSSPPIDISRWKKKLSNDYILLFRAHYEVSKVLNIKNDEFVYDFTAYPNLNDLLKISDILISDYSSIIFDYSILERPIFSYSYDYEKYEEKRGLYLDLNKELPNKCIKNEEELIEQLNNIDFLSQSQKTRKFKKKYIQSGGKASEYIDSIILKGTTK